MEKNLSKRESNKARHKEAIMAAAEKLFLQNGFDSTSIDDVAREARLTKRTLYQYFTSKDDLIYAVVAKGARILSEAYETAMSRGRNALDKIRIVNDVFLAFYAEHPGLYRLMNSLPMRMQPNEQSEHFLELAQLDGKRMMAYFSLVEEAKQDGSINPKLDVRKAVFFDFFASFSLLNMLSTMKDAWEMLKLDEGEFIKFCFQMLTDALKPEGRGDNT